MPAKKTAPKVVAKKATPKVVKKVVAKRAPKVETPTMPVPLARAPERTWATVVKTDMKKPRSWAEWQSRQLDDNRLK